MGHTSEPVVKTENGLDRNPIVLVKKFLSSFPSGHTYDICLFLSFFFSIVQNKIINSHHLSLA